MIIGSGVVIDPWALLDEIESLRGQGVEISPENLKIADNATLILPLHRELDAAREDAARDTQTGVNIGTYDYNGLDILDVVDRLNTIGIEVFFSLVTVEKNLLDLFKNGKYKLDNKTFIAFSNIYR